MGSLQPQDQSLAKTPLSGKADRPQTQVKQSAVPLYAGAFFVGIQLLLLVCFLLRLISLSGSNVLVGVIYAVSALFVLPFHLLLQITGLPGISGLEIDTLLAILIYGLLSRILVRFLKALLNSR
jgi:hypothetical protein